MTISTGAFLKNHYNSAAALGLKAINSDFTLVIEGYEKNWLLCKQAPWAELSPQGEIEIALPNGAKGWQPQQVATAQQGQVAFYETTTNSIDNMLIGFLANTGLAAGSYAMFNCTVYEGTPERHLGGRYYQDCFVQMDPLDRDWENRSQPLMWSGTMFYHYFGEKIPANSTDYR